MLDTRAVALCKTFAEAHAVRLGSDVHALQPLLATPAAYAPMLVPSAYAEGQAGLPCRTELGLTPLYMCMTLACALCATHVARTALHALPHARLAAVSQKWSSEQQQKPLLQAAGGLACVLKGV